MCGYKKERVLKAVEVVTNQFRENKNAFSAVKDYEADNVSKKVVRIILSYTDYVNEKVFLRK